MKLRRMARTGRTKLTRDHDLIRRWVEERNGSPATIAGSGGKEPAGLLRIEFPGYSGKQKLARLTWEDFFAKFDQKNLAFLYQERTADGALSRFAKFVSAPPSQTAVLAGARQPPSEEREMIEDEGGVLDDYAGPEPEQYPHPRA